MRNLFQNSSSHWVWYSEYELKEGQGSVRYVVPAAKATPKIYDPLKEAEQMVLDALNVGMLAMNRTGEDAVQRGVMVFVSRYGLRGFMTALPTTPQFMDYETVYLPANHFIEEESRWNVTDRTMMALMATMQDKPVAVNMGFQREYAERYDWLARQFKDWAFTFCSSFLYYKDYDNIDETTRDLYRQGMAAFGGVASTYHIALLDRPTIVWDFYSLQLAVQMMFSFLLTDDKTTLRCCKHCNKAFIASRPSAVFHSRLCCFGGSVKLILYNIHLRTTH